MDYSKQVIENYTKKLANIENALKTTPLFPDRSSVTPQSFLDEKMELILKVTFKLRVAFLEEMEFILAFASSKATVEAMVLELEKQDYIKSAVSRDLGKYWVLTPTALYYFYTDRTIPYKSATIPAVSLPSSSNVMPLKCINGIIASRVFDDMTNRLCLIANGLISLAIYLATFTPADSRASLPQDIPSNKLKTTIPSLAFFIKNSFLGGAFLKKLKKAYFNTPYDI